MSNTCFKCGKEGVITELCDSCLLEKKGIKLEPVLAKRHPCRYDCREFTWGKFLSLKEWAQKLADEVGYPVYLVGSALTKEVPRDIDVSVIIPLEEYEAKYGEMPTTLEGFDHYMDGVWRRNLQHYFDGDKALGGDMTLDLKFCPDTWFIGKPKLLIGNPTGRDKK